MVFRRGERPDAAVAGLKIAVFPTTAAASRRTCTGGFAFFGDAADAQCVVGAHSVLRRARQNPEKYPWLTQLLARRPFKVVAIALANKMARVAWALLARGGTYRVPALAAA